MNTIELFGTQTAGQFAQPILLAGKDVDDAVSSDLADQIVVIVSGVFVAAGTTAGNSVHEQMLTSRARSFHELTAFLSATSPFDDRLGINRMRAHERMEFTFNPRLLDQFMQTRPRCCRAKSDQSFHATERHRVSR